MKSLAMALLLLALSGCSSEESSWPKKHFVANEWANAAESERYVFVRDIVESRSLVGKPATEVKQLLGKPSAENDAEHYFKTGGDGFNQVYVLDVRVDPTTGAVEQTLIRGD